MLEGNEPPHAGEITVLLARWGGGDAAALGEMMPLVYAELRKIAGLSMRRERANHTLEPTALIHETYLRLARGIPQEIEDRRHFFALMARLMRHVLVDHARRIVAGRRGGGARRVPLEQAPSQTADGLIDLVALGEALDVLRALDERKARVIELRFFAGLDVEETADVLKVSVPTVVNDTRMARAWLCDRMLRDSPP
ncbi:MAG: sigma-70 family RNA polymerase sigma factor [Acidobacteria bacterium]|nr:sigma-70 family RNA polymerase sigma factor [Acidobacteriota bacterium]